MEDENKAFLERFWLLVLHAWHGEVLEVKDLREKAETEVLRQSAQVEHDREIGLALLKFEDCNTDFLQQYFSKCVVGLRAVHEGCSLREGCDNLEADAERMRHWHSERVHRVLFQFIAGDNELTRQAACAAWKEHVTELAYEAEAQKHMAEPRRPATS